MSSHMRLPVVPLALALSLASAGSPAVVRAADAGPISLLPSSGGAAGMSPSPAAPAAPQPSPPASVPVPSRPMPSAPVPSAPVQASPAPLSRPAPSSAPALEVRTADHGSYDRLVFDWPKAVDYRVEQEGGRATITFQRAARIDSVSLQAGLAADVGLQSVDGGAGTTTVTLSVPADARLRHYASGGKVVVDVVRSTEGAVSAAHALPPGGAAPPPALGASDPQPPSVRSAQPQEAPRLPSESLGNAPPPPAAAPQPVVTASTLPPPDRGAADRMAGADRPVMRDGRTYSLSVSWDSPAAAAVFSRAGYLWLVFDRRQEVDTKLLRRLGGEAVKFVEQVQTSSGTALRLIIQPDYSPSLRRDGLLWVIDLLPRPPTTPLPIAVTAPAALNSGQGISLAVADPGSVLPVRDPEVGDTLQVVPVLPLGAGVYPGRDTPDVELLPTVQGIALAPHQDGVEVKTSRSGVTIGLPGAGGLHLSPPNPAMAEVMAASGGVFNITRWMRGGAEHFRDEERLLQAGMVGLPPARLPAAHMAAAQFYFANGYAPEALGMLRVAADEEPTLVDTPAFRALRGASNVLLSRFDLAIPDLDSPLLRNDGEAQFWRACAHAGGSDDPGVAAKDVANGLPLIRNYPKPLKWPLLTLAAQAALAGSDDGTAREVTEAMGILADSPSEKTRAEYFTGAANELIGHFDRAIISYNAAAAGSNREYRARAALAALELQLKTNRINPKNAIEKLDALRFAWRDQNFEFGLLKRLSELQIQARNYPDALRSLRSLAANYPDDKNMGAVRQMMSDTFAKLYQQGAADRMSPVSAIALYDEFRELTPSGPLGDEMIRKLADRLAAVDLLDRAAELLKHQVTYRLQGLDKARVGAQLALLDLLNQKPQEALDALQGSTMDNLPPELLQQRRHLGARALADLGRVPEAMQALSGDTTSEAALLRAEINWRKENWADAAAAFENLVSKPAPGAKLDDPTARLVLSWATALTLANDERGLTALRRGFGSAMTDTPYRDGFNLLTSSLDRDVPDMPSIRAKIKEAEGFQSFMASYRKRLQSGGLSAIN